MAFDVPILLLIFNRPENTLRVLDEIAKAKPQKLYIASDGARKDRDGENETVEQLRVEVLNRINWDCQVETLFRENNLGCKKAVSGAIDWVFSKEGKCIILEDDCLPSSSFFLFCRELLIRYENDTRIWHIDGTNFIEEKAEPGYYFFSKYCMIWGWATWKRAWEQYDVNMKGYEEFRQQQLIRSVWPTEPERKYWIERLDEVYAGKIDTWDFQWFYAMWKNNGLSIRPSVNLIRNIGFGKDATHTKLHSRLYDNMEAREIDFPLITGEFVIADTRQDQASSRVRFNIIPSFVRLPRAIIRRITNLFDSSRG